MNISRNHTGDPSQCQDSDLDNIAPENIIYLDDDDFPSKQVRKGIFERLSGNYTQQEFAHGEGTETSLYSIERTLENGQPFAEGGVTQDSFGLTVQGQNMNFSHNGNDYLLQFEPSEDFRHITLKTNGMPGGDMSCVNDNYSKLICRNAQAMFSVNVIDNNLQWSHVYREGDQVVYSHGAGRKTESEVRD